MTDVSTLESQNWLITPAAKPTAAMKAVGAESPGIGPVPDFGLTDGGVVTDGSRPDVQKWLLILSGVAIIDFQGNSTSDFRRETFRIFPEMHPVLNHAIAEFRIPQPPAGTNPQLAFQVDRCAPCVGLGGTFSPRAAGLFGSRPPNGFRIDGWRLHELNTGETAATGAHVVNLFNGLNVDVAVLNTGAKILRLNYTISLLGWIIFLRAPVIL